MERNRNVVKGELKGHYPRFVLIFVLKSLQQKDFCPFNYPSILFNYPLTTES